MNYSEIKEPQREFYCYLGLLSTKFAIMEYNVLKTLGLLIADDFILAGILFEKNTLYQNIELLKKISEHRGYETKALKDLIVKINNIKSKRNLFVHGTWSEPYECKGNIMIKCYEPKIDQKKEFRDGILISTSTSQRKVHPFKLSSIKTMTNDLDNILNEQTTLMNGLREYLDEHNMWD